MLSALDKLRADFPSVIPNDVVVPTFKIGRIEVQVRPELTAAEKSVLGNWRPSSGTELREAYRYAEMRVAFSNEQLERLLYGDTLAARARQFEQSLRELEARNRLDEELRPRLNASREQLAREAEANRIHLLRQQVAPYANPLGAKPLWVQDYEREINSYTTNQARNSTGRAILNYVPVIGSVASAVESFNDGNWAAGLGHVLMAGLDLAPYAKAAGLFRVSRAGGGRLLQEALGGLRRNFCLHLRMHDDQMCRSLMLMTYLPVKEWWEPNPQPEESRFSLVCHRWSSLERYVMSMRTKC